MRSKMLESAQNIVNFSFYHEKREVSILKSNVKVNFDVF